MGDSVGFESKPCRSVTGEEVGHYRELEISEPVPCDVGDVTVHDLLAVHGAGENLMDRPRRAYILLTQPADVR